MHLHRSPALSLVHPVGTDGGGDALRSGRRCLLDLRGELARGCRGRLRGQPGAGAAGSPTWRDLDGDRRRALVRGGRTGNLSALVGRHGTRPRRGEARGRRDRKVAATSQAHCGSSGVQCCDVDVLELDRARRGRRRLDGRRASVRPVERDGDGVFAVVATSGIDGSFGTVDRNLDEAATHVCDERPRSGSTSTARTAVREPSPSERPSLFDAIERADSFDRRPAHVSSSEATGLRLLRRCYLTASRNWPRRRTRRRPGTSTAAGRRASLGSPSSTAIGPDPPSHSRGFLAQPFWFSSRERTAHEAPTRASSDGHEPGLATDSRVYAACGIKRAWTLNIGGWITQPQPLGIGSVRGRASTQRQASCAVVDCGIRTSCSPHRHAGRRTTTADDRRGVGDRPPRRDGRSGPEPSIDDRSTRWRDEPVMRPGRNSTSAGVSSETRHRSHASSLFCFLRASRDPEGAGPPAAQRTNGTVGPLTDASRAR